MFSTGQPFLSLISLTVSVDVTHHIYFIGQPHLDILLRCPALNTKGQVSSELPSSTCTTWDKTSAPWHMHGIGESWIPESVALPESRTSVTGEQALSHVHNGYTMRKASEKSLITTTTTKNKTNQQWFPSGHDLRLSIVLRLLQYTYCPTTSFRKYIFRPLAMHCGIVCATRCGGWYKKWCDGQWCVMLNM